jgi:hypothetical protein
MQHDLFRHKLKHFCYAGGWKKFEPIWNFLIKTKNLNNTLPLLERVLAKVRNAETHLVGMENSVLTESRAKASVVAPEI